MHQNLSLLLSTNLKADREPWLRGTCHSDDMRKESRLNKALPLREGTEEHEIEEASSDHAGQGL